MVRQVPNEFPQFYLTAPAACPYLDGRYEKKIFTHLMGDEADQLNNMLTQAGFRRSQGIAYRPACEDCSACVSVRILADAYKPSKNHKRVLKRNADILSKEVPATGTNEQFSLLRTYLDTRHADGGMAEMTPLDYAAMVEDTNVNTMLVEYRLPLEPGAFTKEGRLIGLALTDQMEDGLSMVYSFFDPEFKDRSLGTYLILDHIIRTQKRAQPYLYLGYWVDGCQKMSYKARFQPIEALGLEGWQILTSAAKTPLK
ncbi:MAG: arginyltransferase [Parvibaculaceae bacterium]|nr:arginyltransferase [Parvibaculaceae bacterium]